MVKSILLLCASALFAQLAFAQQYIGNNAYVAGNSIVDNDVFINGGYGLGNLGIGSGLGSGFGSILGLGNAGLSGYGSVNVAAPVGISSATLSGLGGNYNIVASSPLAVTTISPIGPSGLAVASENVIEGVLAVSGQLPFLSAVAFEGALPTAGSGVATCGCGNGQVGITAEGLPASGLPLGIPGYSTIGTGIGGLYF